MAAFNFPNSPSTNDLHTENGVTYKWNGTVWKRQNASYTDATNLNVTGISTVGSITGVAATFTGNVQIGGVLTYEDVKNVDSVGIVTARTGIHIDDSITHIGDTNTKIRFPAADTFTIETAGSERVRVDSSGNFGINTNNPTAELDVERATGTVEVMLQSRDSSDCFVSFGDNGDSDIGQIRYAHSDNSMRFTTNTGERVRITSSGLFGIGTNSPDKLLHVYHATTNYISKFESGDSTVQVGFFDGDTSNGTYVGAVGENLTFYTNGFNERLRIDSSGKLLINSSTVTASYGGKLQLTNSNFAMNSFAANQHAQTFLFAKSRGTSGSGGTIVQDNDFCGHIEWYADDGENTENQIAKISARIDGTPGVNDTPGELLFYTTADGANASTERLRITSAGRVGIGEDSPVCPLHINSDANNLLTLQSTDRYSTLYLVDTVGSSFIQNDSGHLRFGTGGGANAAGGETERLRITSTGNVDINGTPPWTVNSGNYRNLSISGEGASGSGFLWLGNGAAATNADFHLGRISFMNGATRTSLIAGSTDTSANDDGRLVFYTKATGGSETERLRITSAGKIVMMSQGAAVSDGYAALEVRQNTGGKHLVLATNSATSSTNEVMLGFKLHPSGQDERVKAAIICRGTASNDYGQPSRMSFCLDGMGTNDNASIAGAGNERLSINVTGQYQGHVDIKGLPPHLRLYSFRNTNDWDNTDPIGKLDFYVGDDTSNNLPYTAGFIHCLNEVDNTGEPSGALLFGTTTANLSGGAVERLRITSDGKVGINKTDPSYQLHVCEDSSVVARFERTGGAWAKVDIKAGNNTGNSYLTFSDTDAAERGEINYEHSDDSLRFGTAGTANRMKIDSDGYVTKPNTPYFHVQGSPSISNTPHDNGCKQFAQIRSNNGSHYSNSTGVFTVPVAGFYFFSAGLWSSNSDANNGTNYALLYRLDSNGNNGIGFAGANHHDQWGQLTMAAGYYCAEGDQIFLSYNGSIQGSTPRNYFSGCLLA